MKLPELLIPASSLEVLRTAVIYGADAVTLEERHSDSVQRLRILRLMRWRRV